MRISAFRALAAALFMSGVVAGASAQEQGQGQAGQQGQPGVVAVAPDNFDPNQPIRPGFTLSVSTRSAMGEEPDFSGTFTVDAAGNISMKLVGQIGVRGQTPQQAADTIAGKLKTYIKNPVVTVNIIAVPKPVILYSGAVLKPGANLINDQTSLGEAVTIFGYSPEADLTRVRVVHKDEKGNRTTREYNLLRWLKPAPGEQPDESQNPILSDRDFIYLPPRAATTGTVTVEGAVLRPGIVPIRVGVPMTLREVISLAGGPLPTAERRSVSVRRAGVERQLLLDFDRLEAGVPTDNIVVQPDDIVYVQTLGVDLFVNLNGAFVRPGKLPYQKEMTLTQAIAEAGGLTIVAKDKDGRVFRHVAGPDPTKTQIIPFNYDKIRKNQQPDILLEPGDTVEVQTGLGPKPPLDPLQLAQALFSIALSASFLFGGRRSGF